MQSCYEMIENQGGLSVSLSYRTVTEVSINLVKGYNCIQSNQFTNSTPLNIQANTIPLIWTSSIFLGIDSRTNFTYSGNTLI